MLGGSHQLCPVGQQSLGNPGDSGDCASLSQGRVQIYTPQHSHGSWSGVMCCSALTLALLFAREKGEVEDHSHTMQAWAAHEGQWAQQLKSPQGLGHFGDTAQCGWRSSQHTHPAAGEGPGSWQRPWRGKTRRETPKQTQPKGARLARGHLERWQSLAAVAGGQQGSPSLLDLTWQIPLVVHQGFATCGCSSFVPILGVLGTGLISTPAQG